MRGFLGALAFLTIVPVPRQWLGDPDAPPALGFAWFPLIGLLIGGFMAGLQLLLEPLFGELVLAAVLTFAWAAATGGLHLDGLADSADGFVSHRPRERTLEIMKDSSIGVMAMLALHFNLLLKLTVLWELQTNYPGPLLGILLVAPIVGRATMGLQMRALPYARPEGMAKAFWRRHDGLAWWHVLWLLGPAWLLLRWAGLAASTAAVVGLVLFLCWAWGRIRGGTGDTLGAASELAETTFILAALAALNGGLPA